MWELVLRILLTALLVILLLAIWVVLPLKPKANSAAELGVTFSIHAAEALGLDWEEAWAATVQDLNPQVVRLPIYWDLLQPDQETFNWEPFDRLLQEIDGRETKVIWAIGHKLPRWPECHLPTWTADLTLPEIEAALMFMLSSAVDRYKDHPNTFAWQVENESLFPFGECPDWSSDRGRLKREIQLVKELDPDHSVMTTDSGELSTWLRTLTLPVDALGVSLYRVVYNPRHDYFHWPVNPYYYRLHAHFARLFVDHLHISELQMEPWGPKPVQDLEQSDIYESFSPYAFDDRIDFARRTSADTILTWGVEWWYYMKVNRGNTEYWDRAIKAFNRS